MGEVIHNMSSLNISISESLREFVKQRVASAGYSTPSEYIRQLIREDQKAMAKEQLEALLLEGLESGEPIAVDEDYWKQKKVELAKRLAEQKKGSSE